MPQGCQLRGSSQSSARAEEGSIPNEQVDNTSFYIPPRDKVQKLHDKMQHLQAKLEKQGSLRSANRIRRQIQKLKRDIFKVVCRRIERRLRADIADLITRLHVKDDGKHYHKIIWACDNDFKTATSSNCIYHGNWGNRLPMLPTMSLLPSSRAAAASHHLADYHHFTSIASPPYDGLIALHWASFTGNVYTLDVLNLDGIDMRGVGLNGCNAMHWACYGGRLESVFNLVCSGAGPDLQMYDYDGWCPIHYAVHQGHAHMLPFLQSHGCDVNAAIMKPIHREARFFDGWTPLDLAVFHQHGECAFLLRHRFDAVHSIEFLSNESHYQHVCAVAFDPQTRLSALCDCCSRFSEGRI